MKQIVVCVLTTHLILFVVDVEISVSFVFCGNLNEEFQR